MPPRFVRLLKDLIILLLPLTLVVGSVLAYTSANFQYVREGQPLKSMTNQRLEDTALYNSGKVQHMQDVMNISQ